MNDSLKRPEEKYWQDTEQHEVFRHRQAMRWLEDSSSPVLDVGCGDGFLLAKLKGKGIDAWGVDVSQVAVEKCRARGLEAEVCDFCEGNFPERPARTAAILDVLEHLENPLQVLNGLHGKVQTLIISVPNFSSLPARLQVACGRVPENFTPRKLHRYWYTSRVLQDRLRESGWKVVAWGMNAPWGNKPVIGYVMGWLAARWPSLWSLSFVVKCERV